MIKYVPIDTNKVRNLIAGIQDNISKLSNLADLSLEEFSADAKNFGLAEHYLRRSLEGVLTIGTHILSRLPSRAKDYQEIILSLAEHNIIPKDFAEKNRKLASYRNRLVHMYWEVSKKELHTIINEHLDDIDQFCQYFQNVLQDPKKFGLKVE